MTVQAPHWPRSQPFLVPVSSRRSRRRSRSITRGSSSWIVLLTPFTVRVVEKAMLDSVGAMKREIRGPKKHSGDDDWPAFAWLECYVSAWLVAIYGGFLRFSRGR